MTSNSNVNSKKQLNYSNGNATTSTKSSRGSGSGSFSQEDWNRRANRHTHGTGHTGSGKGKSSKNSSSYSNTDGSKSSRSNSSNSHSSKHNNQHSNNQYQTQSKKQSVDFMSSSNTRYNHNSKHSNNLSNYNSNNTNSKNNNQSSNNQSTSSTTSLRKPLDPTLLARGMTARAIGSRVSNNIKGLSNFEIDKDIRHMEAYGAACIVYAQQYFAFTNRELVVRGHYGPISSLAGMGYLTQGMDGDGIDNGENGGTGENENENGETGTTTIGDNNTTTTTKNGKNKTNIHTVTPTPTTIQSTTNITNNNTNQTPPQPLPGIRGITMPIRIDPEEEKRLTLLRNRVSISESKREVLETEYLSLRAHYVHESHSLQRARDGLTGQLKLLKDLVEKRGEALGLYRVKYAMAQDILHSLEFRSKELERLEEEGGSGSGGMDVNDAPTNGNTGTKESQ